MSGAGQVVDAEQACRLGAEDHRREMGGGRVKKVPWAMLAPRVAGKVASVAVSEMPLVLMAGTKELR